MKTKTVNRSLQILDRLQSHTAPVYSRSSLQEGTSSETSLRFRSISSPNQWQLQHSQIQDRYAHSVAPQQETKKRAHTSLEDWLVSRPPSSVYSSDNLPTSSGPATFSSLGPQNCLPSDNPKYFANLIKNSPTERQVVAIERLGAAACAIPSRIPTSSLPIPLHLLRTALPTIHVLAIESRQSVLSPSLQHTAAVASELSTRLPSSGHLLRKAIVASVKPSGLSSARLLLCSSPASATLSFCGKQQSCL